MNLPACPVCGQLLNDPVPHECPGPNTQPVHEVALAIVGGDVFTDADAVRVARAYIALTGVRSVSEAKERPVQSGDVREDGDPGRARMPIGEGLRLGHVSLTNPTHQPPNADQVPA